MSLFEAVRHVTAYDAAVRAGLPLRRVGARYWTRCPVHGEKTASLCVYEGDRGWYCFGCGAGGDAVRLYALLYSEDDLSAARRLATDFGLLESDVGRFSMPREVKGTLYDLERAAKRWLNGRWAALCDARHAADAELQPLADPDTAWDNPAFVRALRVRSAADYELDRLQNISLIELIEIYGNEVGGHERKGAT